MFFTWPSLAQKRPDRRPLYRQIFTHRRLDIAHKVVVRSIIGFLLFSSSYCLTNGIIYYKYVRPLRHEERELLERELIEADRAGFHIKSVFLVSLMTLMGSFSVFKKKQLEKELTKYELNLKDLDDTIAKSPETAFTSNPAVGS
ncbi:hypothetical protein FO519_001921 [Halicephalobus sp. NKZ332]|nr:hypothetical protein FO519_001921 [Halicephalobus sp. NKZ332]